MNETWTSIFSTVARKMWGGGVGAFLLGVAASMGEGGNFSDITTYEWVLIFIGTLGSMGLVYNLPNKPLPFTLSDYSPAPVDKQVAPLSEVRRLESEIDYLSRMVAVNRVDTSSSAPATMNTIRASDV